MTTFPEGSPAIVVTDLHKNFTLSNTAIGSLKTLFVWWRRRSKQELAVLKGLTFEVRRGECVALVGRNGAGKSTLLSILSKIYKPTSGSVKVNGRMAPLLELGAGFHPDLTGAENIEYNAVILGLTRAQVRDRFEEIVAFSEMGEHIFAPVRTYSSGMIARLGFAVATHVDAEILIVDEVLSVGDFDFTQKCLKRLRVFKDGGGTILLVSHSRETVLEFAERVIWIQHGIIQREGDPTSVLDAYLAQSESDLGTRLA